MPIVLTQSEASESGHDYADVLGERYEYPRQYRKLIVTGEVFVYYRGRRTVEGPSRPQAYLGTGVIGTIFEAPDEQRMSCAVEDYVPFPVPLGFKDLGTYFEVAATSYGARAGLYFRNGVRHIDNSTFIHIVSSGQGTPRQEPSPNQDGVRFGYASPEDTRLVDDVAMELAERNAATRWPESVITRMPHNNPGFDLTIREPTGREHFIEVKGTRKPLPLFLLSEGQRLFATAHADAYSLWVFSRIDLVSRSGVLTDHVGPLTPPAVKLQPKQWAGVLRPDG